MKSNRLPLRKCKKISIGDAKDSPSRVVYALNDGRLAIGGENKLVIYNINTNKIDIKINITTPHSSDVHYIYQLKDKNLFYCSKSFTSNFNDWSKNIFHYNYLIEISDKNYINKTNLLPEESKYDILKEYSKGIVFGGITYDSTNIGIRQTNGCGKPRIEKIVKINDKYQIVTSYKIWFKNFLLLNCGVILILSYENLNFLNINTFKLKKKVKIYDIEKINVYNNTLLLIGINNNKVLIYNYKTYKKVKSIVLNYNASLLYVSNNVAFIIGYDKVNDYIIENNGEYKHFSLWPKTTVSDITQLKDGRIVTSGPLRIWN